MIKPLLTFKHHSSFALPLLCTPCPTLLSLTTPLSLWQMGAHPCSCAQSDAPGLTAELQSRQAAHYPKLQQVQARTVELAEALTNLLISRWAAVARAQLVALHTLSCESLSAARTMDQLWCTACSIRDSILCRPLRSWSSCGRTGSAQHMGLQALLRLVCACCGHVQARCRAVSMLQEWEREEPETTGQAGKHQAQGGTCRGGGAWEAAVSLVPELQLLPRRL